MFPPLSNCHGTFTNTPRHEAVMHQPRPTIELGTAIGVACANRYATTIFGFVKPLSVYSKGCRFDLDRRNYFR